jgi:hypothetical protein
MGSPAISEVQLKRGCVTVTLRFYILTGTEFYAGLITEVLF